MVLDWTLKSLLGIYVKKVSVSFGHSRGKLAANQ